MTSGAAHGPGIYLATATPGGGIVFVFFVFVAGSGFTKGLRFFFSFFFEGVLLRVYLLFSVFFWFSCFFF